MHRSPMRSTSAATKHKALAAARQTLLQLSAVPQDADSSCACERGACELPQPVIDSLLHLELEPGRQ